MKTSVKFLKTRLALLAFLIVLAAHFGTQPNSASACETCVFPTGGICVACAQATDYGFQNCTAIQETCSCNVSGGICRVCDNGLPCGKGPGSGPGGN